MPLIERIDSRHFEIPLKKFDFDAKHGDHTHSKFITTIVRLSDGTHGNGYFYTGGRGGKEITAMIRHDLAPYLAGIDCEDIDALYDDTQLHVHYVGCGGVASFAISVVDTELWDIRGKQESEPLHRMAGGANTQTKAYCGGIDLNF